MDLQEVKQYLRVDYDDDDELIKLIVDAVVDEMKELIPKFDENNITSRQKILICLYVKDLYDDRERMTTTTSKNEKVRYAVQSLMLKERLR